VTVTWSPRGDLLAAACNDKRAHLWHAESGSLVRLLEGHEGVVKEARFSPDGSRLATGCWDGTVTILGRQSAMDQARLTAR
jgi:WD40 repeat protein